MITSTQIRAGRALVCFSKVQLAAAAGVCEQTVKRIELGFETKVSTLRAIQEALESAGVEFIDRGVRLKEIA
jgi:predicted transcriptional regulator